MPGSRRIALRAVKPFVPRKMAAWTSLNYTGPSYEEIGQIHLTAQSIDVISRALAEAIDRKEQVFEGEIREMDLDKRTFHLRLSSGGGRLTCKFGEELQTTAAELLGRRVRVIGIRRSFSGQGGALAVTDLERIETKRNVKE